MRKIVFAAFLIVSLLVVLTNESMAQYYSVFADETGTELLGATGASAFNHEFKAVVIAADPSNVGVVCIGGTSAVTCSSGRSTVATDGLKLSKGDTVFIGDGYFPANQFYLNNTSLNDVVSYIILK